MNNDSLRNEKLEKRLMNNEKFHFNEVYIYIMDLITNKMYDSANKVLDLLTDKELGSRRSQVANLLYYCYRCDEAIDQLLNKNFLTNQDYILTTKCYLRLGKVSLAKRVLERIEKNDKLTDEIINKINYYKKIISYHEQENEFIEMEYSNFIRNGHTLIPGHVVYLKNTPLVLSGNGTKDEYLNFKTFAIYKIDKTGIYMIPLINSKKEFQYNIKKEDYPIVNKDRYIRSTVCFTNEDNILSVVDKLKDNDLSRIKYSLFLSYYFDKNKDEGKINYLHEQLPPITENMVIDYLDIYTKEKTRYYVIGVEPACYVVYPMDINTNEIINNILLIPKDKLIYATFKPKNDNNEKVLERVKITR